MKVLIVSHYYPPEVGSAPVRLSSWAKALIRHGHEVEVVTAMPNYPTGRIFDEYASRRYLREEIDGVTVHRVWVYAAQGSGLKRLINFISFAGALPFVLRKVTRPDLVLVNSTPLTFAPVVLARAKRWGATSVLSISDLWPQSLIEMGMFSDGPVATVLKRYELAMYRRFDLVNAVTSGIRNTIVNLRGIPARKVTYLPNGVDTDLFSPDAPPALPPDGPDPTERPVFVFPGTLGLFNGLDTVIEAMSILDEQGSDIHFAFVGDGSDRDRLETMTAELGLSNISFCDPVPPETIAGFLPRCAGGVVCLKDLPVTVGARPAKTFPIMGAGIPLIFVGRGEGADLVESTESGLSVAPGDAESLAKAMLQVTSDPDLAARWGDNGRQYAIEHLSWYRLIGDWLAQVQESTGRPMEGLAGR